MANQAVQLFAAYMESQDLGVHIAEEDENVCYVGFNMDNTKVRVLVFFSEDGTDVHFRGGEFVKIPEDKIPVVYKVCNTCNARYRWIKFVWDEEKKEVTCQADAVIQPDSCAEECYEIVGRMVGIVDEAYPEFMKALWT